MEQLFFELIRVAIGTQDTLSRPPSTCEWKELYNMAKKQSLVGIGFAGLQKLYNSVNQELSTHNPQPNPTKNQEPITQNLDEVQYLTWMGMAAKIQQRNEVVNQRCIDLQRMLSEDGISNCVLKGQGIAKLYGSDLCNLRQSGDIDVWCDGGRERIYKYSMEKLGEISGVNYHHIHFPVFDDTEVEMHIYPSFLSSPLRNKRLQDFCKLYAPCECKTEEISTPSLAFNLVFIMLHCYRHLSGHGVGFRQMMDYYFVLLAAKQMGSKGSMQQSCGSNGLRIEQPKALNYKKESLKWVKRLGMSRFAPALMWVMKGNYSVKAVLCA